MNIPADASRSTFDNKTHPFFDRHSSSYKIYRQDVLLWDRLTDLAKSKRVIALIGRLDWQPKAYANTIPVDTLSGDNGLTKVLERLDKA